ncbi:WecB/TagA/CpsF family glycosyltransferase [Blastococcus sp. SYSU DS0669]
MLLLAPDVDRAPDLLVDALVAMKDERVATGRCVHATWLNHHTIRIVLSDAASALARMDVCGIDGQFLKWLLRHPTRTSADLVVPRVLQRDGTIRTVLAIGGHGDRAGGLSAALSGLAGRPVRVVHVDGFDGLLRGAELARLVRSVEPEMVLIGLGAGLQEQVLLEAADAMAGGYAMTCGGFLDQVLQPGYYPAWAYPLRLNWLVRLAREPRRLWRRYTVGAVRALTCSARWRRAVRDVPGVDAHAWLCGAGGGRGTAPARAATARRIDGLVLPLPRRELFATPDDPSPAV